MIKYFRKFAFDTLHFWICLTFVSCEENSKQYEHVSGLIGKICPSTNITFMQTAASKIECAFICRKDATCKSMVYSPADMTCFGCTKSQYEPNGLGDKPGAVFYKPSIVDCGPPSFDDPHVLLGPHNGDNSVGANIVYSCEPCTYFPISTPAVVMCLDAGVWSSPSCVSGGVSVPDSAKGCLLEFGNVCSAAGSVTSGFTMHGTTADCMCDGVCCEYADCCFDADCLTP